MKGTSVSKRAPKWKYEHRGLDELRPHPSNEIYGNLSESELQSLAADMKTRGQQHAIDILPDGTIIGGHQRWRAAKLLDWKSIRCRVRFDLVRRGDDAIEEFLLRDNFNRRQLHPLHVARVYRRLKELERKKKRRGSVNGDLRDFIAKELGKSGRTLDRYSLVLDAPIEVQNAFAAGQLRLLDACRVAGLDDKRQKEIAQRIREGETPGDVVLSYFEQEKSGKDNVGTLLGRLLRDLKRHTNVLGDRVDEIEAEQWAEKLPAVQEAEKLIRRVRERIETIAKTSRCPKAKPKGRK